MLLVSISGLRLTLSYLKPLYVQVIIADGEFFKVVYHTFAEYRGDHIYNIPERPTLSLPFAVKEIGFSVYVRKAKSRKPADMRFYGRVRVALASCPIPGGYAPQEKPEIYTLLDEKGSCVGSLSFTMHLVSTMIEASPTVALRNTDHPVILTMMALKKVLQEIETTVKENKLIAQCLLLLDVVERASTTQLSAQDSITNHHGALSASGIAELNANQGNVMEDLLTQFLSHMEFLRDVVSSAETARVSRLDNTTAVHTRTMLKLLFDTIVPLHCWADMYTWATYTYFSLSRDTSIQHVYAVMRAIMQASVPCRHAILCGTHPEIRTFKPVQVSNGFEGLLGASTLYEMTYNLPPWNTKTLYSLRHAQAQKAMEWIQIQLKVHLSDAEPTRRDILRRMLTHVAQESHCLPPSLILSVTMDEQSHVDGGAYSAIHRGRMYHNSTMISVALKSVTIYPRTGDTEQRLRQMYLEVLSCQSLSCGQIAEVLGIYQAHNQAYIVMPYFAHGNTINYRTQVLRFPAYRNGRLLDLVHKWFYDLAKGLDYLHREGVVHGDIRGVNLLVDDNESLRIADFGLSVFANGKSKQYLSRRSGNAQWMAPETMSRNEGISSRPTSRSDVYSFAHVCIELYTGRPPYDDIEESLNDVDPRYSTVQLRKRPCLPALSGLIPPKIMDEEIYGILDSCWNEDPEARPSICEVIRMLETLDFGRVYPDPQNK